MKTKNKTVTADTVAPQAYPDLAALATRLAHEPANQRRAVRVLALVQRTVDAANRRAKEAQ